MSARAVMPLLCLLLPQLAPAASRGLPFEDIVRMSDRIVVATVLGSGGGSISMGDGTKVALGVKDTDTGLVFTPWRVRVEDCLLDLAGGCEPGNEEVFTPGGTVYETIQGREILRTWEVRGAGGTPLSPVGSDFVLFMTRRSGRFMPINDPGARLRVGGSQGARTVDLRSEPVPIERLKTIIPFVRRIPKPTSGPDHATPDSGAARRDTVVRRGRAGLRAGEVSDGR